MPFRFASPGASLRRCRQSLAAGLGCLLLAAAVAVRPAAAQSPEQRADVTRFRDSIAGVDDSLALLKLERQLIDVAKADRNNAVQHLKLGFLSLRLGDLGGRAHYDDAASEFQWAIDLQPQWPFAWYGMGLAEYGVGDSQISIVAGLQTMLGKDALTRSAMAFAKSAEVDPAFVSGLVELANTALRQRVNIKLGVALDALRRSAATPAGSNPDVLLARGRVEREVGDADSALIAFRSYRDAGADLPLAQLEIARTQLLMGSFDGLSPYYEGAAQDDSAAVAGYRGDLAMIATDEELEELDAARGEARAAFLKRFWGERDRQAMRPAGERVREHYRRLFYAKKNFSLVSLNRHYDIAERYKSGSRDFDDRGIIYIRHGEPTARATYNAPGVEPNVSWRYSRADGDLVFHFIAREDVQDYKLVESLFDVLGYSNAILLQANDDAFNVNTAASQLLLSREALSPIYGRMQSAGRVSASQYQNEERRIGRQAIALGTSTDSYELPFAKPLKVKTEVLAVGRDSSGPQVHIAYALAGSALDPVQVSQGYLYDVRLRFVATDSTGAVVATLDTTRHFVAEQPVPPTEHLVGHVAMPVPAGKLAYRVALQQGEEAGVVLPSESVSVATPAPAAPVLSDIVLGSRRTNLIWRPTNGDTVFFNPLRTYAADEQMQVYYEIAGLAPGGDYETEIKVKKRGGSSGFFSKIFGGGTALSLRFTDRATGASVPVQRSFGLDKLKPGQYTLEVVVSDGAKRTLKREAVFQVVDEEE